MAAKLTCYAQTLGDCSEKMSNEHYVSDSVLRLVSQAEKAVLVRGLSFLEPDEERPIGIGKLTSPILCETHNHALRPLDNAGEAFFAAMERVMASGRDVPLHINGKALEGWMLKTFVGGLYGGRFPLPDRVTRTGVLPPSGFLRALFENERLPEPLGVYVLHPKEDFLIDRNVLRVQPASQVAEGSTHVHGITMWVFGVAFFLNVTLPKDRFEHATYRPTAITGPDGETLVIEWPGIGGDRPVLFRPGSAPTTTQE